MSAHSSAVVLDDRQRGVEVMAKATRRRFTAEYKLRVLREADACMEPGEIGVLLRREGLYTSHLCLWRKQRRARELSGLTPARRGPAPKATNPLAATVAALEQKTRWLTARAERAEALVELQKKVSEILGIELQRHGETN
jgi:transposase